MSTKKLTFTLTASTIKRLEIEFDWRKSDANTRLRGLPFQIAENFDFTTALYQVDDRRAYGETRIRALGRVGNRVHALVFTETVRGIRVISLRKANQREVKCYEEEIARS